jgi:hypothetical protein
MMSFISASAVAQWQSTEAVESMTDDKMVRVTTRNADGYRLGIVEIGRTKDVHLFFGLPDTSTETLNPTKYIVYRVDKQVARDFQRISALAAQREMAARGGRHERPRLIVVQPRWFSGAIWTPRDDVGSPLAIYEIMEGRQLRVRYFTTDGRQRETVFDLGGAAAAIAGRLGIPQHIDAAKRQEMLLARAERHAASACGFRDNDEQIACHKLNVNCALKFDMDSDDFFRCIGWK